MTRHPLPRVLAVAAAVAALATSAAASASDDPPPPVTTTTTTTTTTIMATTTTVGAIDGPADPGVPPIRLCPYPVHHKRLDGLPCLPPPCPPIGCQRPTEPPIVDDFTPPTIPPTR